MSHWSWISPLLTSSLLLALGLAFQPNAASAQGFSHDDWDSVLGRFVDERGFVDYEGLSRDRAVFDRYVAQVESKSPKSHPNLFPGGDDKLAYYLNAYNALVFKGVLSRGPEKKSVWSGLISGFNFFVRMKVKVGGETMSLKSLEDKLIRDAFKDPRIHAALNCASISCPRLPQKAFVAATLQTDLDAAMREFVTTASHFKIDQKARTVWLSEIFDFFPADFLGYEKAQGNAKPNILDYINRYRPADGQAPRDFKVKYFDYDKGINKQ